MTKMTRRAMWSRGIMAIIILFNTTCKPERITLTLWYSLCWSHWIQRWIKYNHSYLELQRQVAEVWELWKLEVLWHQTDQFSLWIIWYSQPCNKSIKSFANVHKRWRTYPIMTIVKSRIFQALRRYAFWCWINPWAMIFIRHSAVKINRKAYSTFS